MPSDLREGEEIRRDDMGKGGSSTSQSGVYMGYILWRILPLRRLMRAYEGLTSSPEGWKAMAVILVVRFMTDFIMRGTEEEEEEVGAWFRLTPPPAPPPALVLGMPMLLVRLSRWYSVITPDSAPTATKLLLLLLLLPLLLLPVVCFVVVREPCSWACRLGGGGASQA